MDLGKVIGGVASTVLGGGAGGALSAITDMISGAGKSGGGDKGQDAAKALLEAFQQATQTAKSGGGDDDVLA